MKNLYALIGLLTLFFNGNNFAQDTNQNWLISLGYSNLNISDGLFMEQSITNFNTFQYPNTLSIEKQIHNKFSFQFSGIYNQFQPKLDENNKSESTSNISFYSFDVKLKYNLSDGLGKNGWFDPFLIGGLGYSKINILGDAKYAGGLGSNLWIKPNLGLQLNSTFHKGFEAKNSNMIAHTIGIIYKFKSNYKEVSHVAIPNSENIVSTQKEIKNKRKKEKIEKKVISSKDPITVSKETLKTEYVITIESSENTESSKTTNNQIEPINKEIKIEDSKLDPKTEILIEEIKTEVKKFEPNNEIAIKEIETDDANMQSKTEVAKNTLTTEKNISETASEITTVQNNPEEPKNHELEPKTYQGNSSKTKILKISTVYFDLNQSNVLDDEKSKIHMIIYILDKNPNAKILIEGHSAQKGENEPIKLSQSRAMAIKQYLLKKGVDATKIEIKSLGNSEPMIQESKNAEINLNRRAKIVLYQN